MRTFTIDSDNNIMVFASEKQAKTSNETGAVIFTTEDELAKLATDWPISRLVEIWNSLTGVTPVKKFTDRKTAIARIWKSIQSLQPAPEAQEKAAPARDVGTGRAAKSKATSKAKGVRSDSKTAKVVDLLKRANGVTLEELVDATGWKANSVRGFISGSIGKKMGLKVESTKGEDGKRAYSIA